MSQATGQRVLCIGGGPAGLTAAYLLSKKGVAATVLEADPSYLGGISRTVCHNGYYCDIGGHRFFSKSAEVNRLWRELMPDGFLRRPRKSRIYYRGNFFDYPLQARNALGNLGVFEAVRCVLSYLRARIFPIRNEANFEEWVTNRFGHRLFSIFFEAYTEKVWGMKCSEISADWAAQRIKGFSLWAAARSALLPQRQSDEGTIKTLINAFDYPERGPGMMWESAGRKIAAEGGVVERGRRAVRLKRLAGGGWSVASVGLAGDETHHEAEHVISSAPLAELVEYVDPPAPAEVLDAANGLKYRDFLVVGLVVLDRDAFDDQWIYVHDPGVKVGRIQNFKSWSPAMVPEGDRTCYGMEYFCFEGDGLWASSDEALVRQATKELVKLGLARPDDVHEGFVVRQKKAYPVYDDEYAARVDVIRRFVETECPGLQVVGRNGMHKYNNQDHAMMTAMLAVENIMAGENRYDIWRVNQDAEYHEEDRGAGGGRLTPTRTSAAPSSSSRPAPDKALTLALACAILFRCVFPLLLPDTHQ